jgi:hypothetical protein
VSEVVYELQYVSTNILIYEYIECYPTERKGLTAADGTPVERIEGRERSCPEKG